MFNNKNAHFTSDKTMSNGHQRGGQQKEGDRQKYRDMMNEEFKQNKCPMNQRRRGIKNQLIKQNQF